MMVEAHSADKIDNSANLESSFGSVEEISIDADNASSFKLKDVQANKATVSIHNLAIGEFAATAATLNMDNASKVDFAASDANVTMNNPSNGSAEISGTLDVDMDNGSNLTCEGGGKVGSQRLKNGSNLNSG
jgi:hypothetical protein